MQPMKKILITGATGFIGKVLTRQLTEAGYEARALIRPSRQSPNLPVGVPIEVAVSGLNDPRGLSSALVDVDVIYHLASEERRGGQADLLKTDIQGTQAVVQAAQGAGVERFFYLSHLGADRASAYPVLTAKAIAEEHIRNSALDYTIMRSAIIFGPGDGFTTELARLLRRVPFFFFLPDGGETLLQPLWVQDLATTLVWALDNDDTRRQTYEIGGPEFLTFREMMATIMEVLGIKKTWVPIRTPYLRSLTVLAEYILPNPPTNVYWLDYLATNHTCSLTTIPQRFNLLPSRFGKRLDYLKQ
ncbi:MAG: 2-alkyl-3-oxoalkanoate reductase [Chloroflexi bacterium]|nr:2-alkyl-3-oxoalkanoate reductase [Chloroflexota bacterium]